MESMSAEKQAQISVRIIGKVESTSLEELWKREGKDIRQDREEAAIVSFQHGLSSIVRGNNDAIWSICEPWPTI